MSNPVFAEKDGEFEIRTEFKNKKDAEKYGQELGDEIKAQYEMRTAVRRVQFHYNKNSVMR